MKQKDKEDLRKLAIHLNMSGFMSTFPNGRHMDFFDSTAINQIGKTLGRIHEVLEAIIKGKKPKKSVGEIRDLRLKLEELYDEFKLR